MREKKLVVEIMQLASSYCMQQMNDNNKTDSFHFTSLRFTDLGVHLTLSAYLHSICEQRANAQSTLVPNYQILASIIREPEKCAKCCLQFWIERIMFSKHRQCTKTSRLHLRIMPLQTWYHQNSFSLCSSGTTCKT